jgi:hypothetical protein
VAEAGEGGGLARQARDAADRRRVGLGARVAALAVALARAGHLPDLAELADPRARAGLGRGASLARRLGRSHLLPGAALDAAALLAIRDRTARAAVAVVPAYRDILRRAGLAGRRGTPGASSNIGPLFPGGAAGALLRRGQQHRLAQRQRGDGGHPATPCAGRLPHGNYQRRDETPIVASAAQGSSRACS